MRRIDDSIDNMGKLIASKISYCSTTIDGLGCAAVPSGGSSWRGQTDKDNEKSRLPSSGSSDTVSMKSC